MWGQERKRSSSHLLCPSLHPPSLVDGTAAIHLRLGARGYNGSCALCLGRSECWRAGTSLRTLSAEVGYFAPVAAKVGAQNQASHRIPTSTPAHQSSISCWLQKWEPFSLADSSQDPIKGGKTNCYELNFFIISRESKLGDIQGIRTFFLPGACWHFKPKLAPY